MAADFVGGIERLYNADPYSYSLKLSRKKKKRIEALCNLGLFVLFFSTLCGTQPTPNVLCLPFLNVSNRAIIALYEISLPQAKWFDLANHCALSYQSNGLGKCCVMGHHHRKKKYVTAFHTHTGIGNSHKLFERISQHQSPGVTHIAIEKYSNLIVVTTTTHIEIRRNGSNYQG